MELFLSYAEQDREAGREIASWLKANDFDVFDWLDPNVNFGQFIKDIEEALKSADAFVALLSPSYLSSRWCRHERQLAMQYEQDLQKADEPNRTFIHVVRILDTSNADVGFLRNYNWTDLSKSADKMTTLRSLIGRLQRSSEPGKASSEVLSPPPTSPRFQNRQDEVEKIIRGITTTGGQHFWLVVAPPQLGKTWFLERLSRDPGLREPTDWVTRQLDLRAESADVRADVAALLARLFDRPSSIAIGTGMLREIARAICRSGRPHLCLLDGAELLTQETAATLRSCLSQIYYLVQKTGMPNVRLALVVASRREEEWRGITPAPRLSPLSLTEFNVEVVEHALQDLAHEMNRTISPSDQKDYATHVHRLTEGLPALLVRFLLWIQAEEWILDRLEDSSLFMELAAPYIRDGLLTQRSLFPEGHELADEPLQALEQAFRILAPYRLFTQSHLKHYLESDSAFSSALRAAQWSIQDLWRAISGTALLRRPLNEPWQEFHPAIRRLLYRYCYDSPERRIEAHSEARKFVEIWADQQSGKEQVIGLVECLWHEAIVLDLQDSADIEQRLSESAATLSGALRASSAYTVEELRDYASDRMTGDDELLEAVSKVDGLLTSLIKAVVTPSEQ